MTLSVAQKKLRGTYNSTRDANYPEVPSAFPTCPTGHLDKDAQLIWKQAAQLLHEMKCLALIDTFALEGFAKVAATKRALEARLQEEGLVIEHVSGTGVVSYRANPLIKTVDEVDRRYITYLKALGLTPTDRNRLQMVKANPNTGSNAGPVDVFSDF